MLILIGLCFVFLGVMYIGFPTFSLFHTADLRYDLSQYQPIVSISFIIFGLVIIYYEIFSKKTNNKKQTEKICSNCEEVYSEYFTEDNCLKCGEELEELKGFYDRHPEKK